ncbi:MAG: HAD family hydrolase [FCB group bacterium]|nr:HAD family hydrolase [FCB group bacterium]
MKPIVLFDLGQTLVDYFTRTQFPPLVEEGIAAAGRVLGREPSHEVFAGENKEAPDGTVRPLAERLSRIFGIDASGAACDAFTACLIAPGKLYDDTLPVLDELRGRGYRMGIVSNMPWGTPSEPWAEDLERRGLTRYMEHIVFCHDVGWRKPDRRIFEEALRRFDCAAEDALFVGDRPDWDIRGAEDAGLRAVLLDRHGEYPGLPRIMRLGEIWPVLEEWE